MTELTSLKLMYTSMLLALLAAAPVSSFLTPQISSPTSLTSTQTCVSSHQILRQPTSLNVWWFGGTPDKYMDDDESCELVGVLIEKTSANSRQIAGEISVPAPLADVWAILTDYNQLSVHVPNLVESKILTTKSSGSQGDGQYQCRLYQKGAQKIIGFEFGADVTMDMVEHVVVGPPSDDHAASAPQQKKINFKCVDSMFFSNFDGEWSATETIGENGEPTTQLKYVVDVRPKGPVPVAALEWRIREDVPTNLRAVKRAASAVGEAGVLASRKPRNSLSESVRNVASKFELRPVAAMNWGEDETMARYLQSE